MNAVANPQDAAARALRSVSDQERLYIQARVYGSVPVAAARIAGYDDPERACLQLETHPMVAEGIRRLLRAERHLDHIDRNTVLNGLLDAVNMAATATELTMAWREIGKLTGVYEAKKVDVTVNGKKAVRELSESQLVEVAFEGEFEVIEFDEKFEDD